MAIAATEWVATSAVVPTNKRLYFTNDLTSVKKNPRAVRSLVGVHGVVVLQRALGRRDGLVDGGRGIAVGDVRLADGNTFLAKPFTAAALTAKVAALLATEVAEVRHSAAG